MEEKYREELKNTCKLISNKFEKGLYNFYGACAYGLIYLKIPEDCIKIAVPRSSYTYEFCESVYPLDTRFTKKERNELLKYMKTQGFTFSKAFGLDEAPIYLDENKLKLYYYFRR